MVMTDQVQSSSRADKEKVVPPDTVVFAASIGLFALTIYLLVIGQSIFVPLVLAIFITYLLKALAHGLEKITVGTWSIPSAAALTISIFVLLVLIAVLVQMVAGNINAIANAAPEYQARFSNLSQDMMVAFEEWFGTSITFASLTEDIDFQSMILNVAGALKSIASSTFLIFLYVAFLLLESQTLDPKIKAFASTPEREAAIRKTLTSIGRNIEKYVWIKSVMSAAVACMSYILLLIVGVDFAAFWALLIFILNFIPFIGSVVAVILPVVFSLLQFVSLPLSLAVFLGLMAAQILVGNVIEPRIAGKSLNLSPVIIVLSLSVWGAIWGVTGMILSVPIMVMSMIVLAQFPRTKPLAILLSQRGEVH